MVLDSTLKIPVGAGVLTVGGGGASVDQHVNQGGLKRAATFITLQGQLAKVRTGVC